MCVLRSLLRRLRRREALWRSAERLRKGAVGALSRTVQRDPPCGDHAIRANPILPPCSVTLSLPKRNQIRVRCVAAAWIVSGSCCGVQRFGRLSVTVQENPLLECNRAPVPRSLCSGMPDHNPKWYAAEMASGAGSPLILKFGSAFSAAMSDQYSDGRIGITIPNRQKLA